MGLLKPTKFNSGQELLGASRSSRRTLSSREAVGGRNSLRHSWLSSAGQTSCRPLGLLLAKGIHWRRGEERRGETAVGGNQRLLHVALVSTTLGNNSLQGSWGVGGVLSLRGVPLPHGSPQPPKTSGLVLTATSNLNALTN